MWNTLYYMLILAGDRIEIKYILACLLFAMNNDEYIQEKNLKKINLKFMESGHSYLEADSIHAQIKKTRKSQKIYNINEFKLLIETSRKKPKPYDVNQLLYNNFYDLEKLNKRIVQNRSVSRNGEIVKCLDINQIKM